MSIDSIRAELQEAIDRVGSLNAELDRWTTRLRGEIAAARRNRDRIQTALIIAIDAEIDAERKKQKEPKE